MHKDNLRYLVAALIPILAAGCKKTRQDAPPKKGGPEGKLKVEPRPKPRKAPVGFPTVWVQNDGVDGVARRLGRPVEKGSWLYLGGQSERFDCRYYHRYAGEKKVRWDLRGRLLLVGDRIVGLNLRELERAEATKLLSTHRKTVRYLCIDGARASDKQIVAGIKALGPRGLGVVFSGRVKDELAAVAALSTLGPRLELFDANGTTLKGPELKHVLGWKKLRRLRLDDPLNAAQVRTLQTLPELRALRLRWYFPNPVGLKLLGALKNLRELDLSASKLTDPDLKALAGLSKLRSLNLKDTKIDGPGLSVLARTSLEWLDLSGNKLKPGTTAAVARLKKLQYLLLNETPLTAADLTRLGGLPRLRWLSIRGKALDPPHHSDGVLQGLRGYAALEVLDLSFNRIRAGALGALSKLPRLRELDLSHNALTDAHVVGLEKLRGLQALDLTGNRLLSKILPRVAQLTQLRRLDLTDLFFGKRPIAGLSALRHLEDLSLPEAGLDTDRIAPLAKLQKLRRLVVAKKGGFCFLNDKALKHLQGLTELRYLQTCGLYLGDASGDPIRKLKRLRYLATVGSSLGDEGLERIAALSQLRVLNIRDTAVTDDGMEHLTKLRLLEVLHLRKTDVGDRGLLELAKLPNLRKLDLQKCKVTQYGANRFRKATRGRVDLSWRFSNEALEGNR